MTDPYALIRNLAFTPSYGVSANLGGGNRINETFTDEALARARLAELGGFGSLSTVYNPDMAALNAGGFNTKYGSSAIEQDGRLRVNLQQPGAHKFDTMDAYYARDPATGQWVLQNDPMTATTRQTSSARQNATAIATGAAFIGGGSYLAGGWGGAGAGAAIAPEVAGGGLIAPTTAGTVGGGTVAGTGINFGAGAAGSLYTPTGYAGAGMAGAGATAGTAGGWTVGNTLTAAQLASGLYGTYAQGQAAGDAAAAQQAAAQQGITAQLQALQQITQQLAPYTNAGPGALKAQQDLAGLNGPQAQQAAIEALKASPQFTSQQQMGEERILANASATGGLRGGNVQAVLEQFSPALLSQTINDQYARLGGLVNVGQNSAAGVATATMGTANNVSNLFQQQGAAQAGGELARGRQTAGYIGAITNAIGLYYGITGGF